MNPLETETIELLPAGATPRQLFVLLHDAGRAAADMLSDFEQLAGRGVSRGRGADSGEGEGPACRRGGSAAAARLDDRRRLALRAWKRWPPLCGRSDSV